MVLCSSGKSSNNYNHTLRLTKLSDTDEILRLEEQFGVEKFSKQQIRYLIKRKTCISAVWNNTIIGYCCVLLRKNSHKGRLYSIVVDQDHQKNGVGKALLKAVEDKAKRAGMKYLSLEVNVQHKNTVKFYVNQGYKSVTILVKYYRNDANGLKMLKKL